MGAAIGVWILAAAVIVGVLLVALNIAVPSVFGDVRNPEWDPSEVSGTRRDSVERQWAGQLSVIAPPWLVIGYQVILGAVLVVVLAPSRWILRVLGGRVILIANPFVASLFAVIIGAYALLMSRYDGIDGIGPYATPIIISVALLLVGLIGGVFGFRALRREFVAEHERQGKNRRPGGDQS